MSSQPNSPMDKIKILYIVGWSRSGSTILGNILGEIGNNFTVGELSSLSSSKLKEMYCGCGEKFIDCSQWKEILTKAFSTSDLASVQKKLNNLQGNLLFSIGFILFGRLVLSKTYLESLSHLYSALSQKADGDFVIDESKRPGYMYIINHIPNVDLYPLYLVRDPRAVAYSWQRKKIRKESGQYMEVHGIWYSTSHWIANTISSHLLLSRVSSHYFLKYEDFIENPSFHIAKICKWAKFNGKLDARYCVSTKPFLDEKTVNIEKTHHLIISNPVGTQRGKLELQIDNEWESKLPYYQQLLVTLLTWPFLLAYHYPLLPRAQFGRPINRWFGEK